jgi:hypothetical protein
MFLHDNRQEDGAKKAPLRGRRGPHLHPGITQGKLGHLAVGVAWRISPGAAGISPKRTPSAARLPVALGERCKATRG